LDLLQNQKNRQRKKKKKSVKNNQNIKLSAEISDRLDCLLNANGDIVKHQVVGSLTLKYDKFASETNEEYFYGIISNLEQTKTKIFNPLSTETLDKNGQIRVKLEKEKDDESNKQKQVGVLKYIWITNDIKKSLPFLISLKHKYDDDNMLSVWCTIKQNDDNKNNGHGLIKELSITASLKDDILECVQHSELENIEFIWSKDISKKFIWSLKLNKIDKEYVLMSKFKSSTNDNKIQLKIQFEVEHICISEIEINTESNNPDNNASIIKTIKNIKSGEFLLREAD